MRGFSDRQNNRSTEERNSRKSQIHSFRDLRLYQAAYKLQQLIFEITKRFPKSEMYALTDQVRRSSRSIGANLAEAWSKRRYPAHFTSKLTDVDGEIGETYHWLNTAFACQYIESGEHNELMRQLEEIGRMLGAKMIKADKFTL